MFGTPSDNRLIRHALNGRGNAWERLIGRYQKRIYNFALRMTGEREDALDLMQEIFLSVYRNLERFRGEASFSTWLFRIAGHRATDFYRRKKYTDSLCDQEQQHPSSDLSPFRNLARNEANRFLLGLLQQLPRDQRLVVELKFFQEYTFEEISAILGISTNTLKSRLYAALKKIKAMPEVVHAL